MCKRAGTKAVLWNHQNNLCFKPFYRNNTERTLIPSHTHSHAGALLAWLPTLARLLKEGRCLTATKLDMAYYSAERRHEYQQLKRYLSQIPWLPASEIGSWGVESINVVRRKGTPTWKRLTGDAGMTLFTYKRKPVAADTRVLAWTLLLPGACAPTAVPGCSPFRVQLTARCTADNSLWTVHFILVC